MGRTRSNSFTTIPLHRTREDLVDLDNDGHVCYAELWAFLKRDGHGLPYHVIRNIHEKADRNDDGKLDQEEFIHMVLDPENSYFFKPYLNKYIHFLVPPQHLRAASRRVSIEGGRDEYDGLYEDEYSCWPPPIAMAVISAIEIILFIIDAVNGYTEANGPIATLLLYNPHRRKEFWRFLTYMFVHVGYFHLMVNVLVQNLLGTILEMVHRWWRVALIYFAGVVAGSLGTSVVDPKVKLAGASGGVYALITAHVATIIMNWNDMSYPSAQLLVFVAVTVSDVGYAMYLRYIGEGDSHIGYAAHFFGALAGLLVGIMVLRNLTASPRERYLQKIALIAYVLLMIAAIIWNSTATSFFPIEY
ncbi:rhomboid-related protein [Holotrichia oblita]|uniref:Rhomboid-related protein n=1 Tax=Holotrichia oblita TaxID=644536 RepID=A0ACB9SJ62_HOLOL|nr:rhomboid-related protein [Holotrichia oblita]